MEDGRVSRGQRSRQAILKAAYDLFLEQGYAATSMRQIAGRAEIALGGIYNHFPSKEEIFSTLIRDHHPYHQVLPIMMNTPADDPETFVRVASRVMVDELSRRPDFLKLMMIELVEFNGRNMPGIIEGIMPQILPLIQNFTTTATRLKNMDPFVFFRAFIGVFFSYFITEMIITGSVVALSQNDSFEQFVEIFLHGILVERKGQ